MTRFKPFPHVIAEIIAEFCSELQLRSWIQPESLFTDGCIWANPCAYEAGLLDLSQMYLNKSEASSNPALIEWIKKDPELYANNGAWRNHAALDWMLELGKPINWSELSGNPNKRAIELLLDNFDKIHMPEFLANPSAMPYIKAHPELLQGDPNTDYIKGNPEAINMLKLCKDPGLLHGRFSMISSNPHPWAIEQCRLHWGDIDVPRFSMNPGIFHHVTNKKLVKLLSHTS